MKKIGFALIPLTLSLWLSSPVPAVLRAHNSPADHLNGESEASQTRQHPRFRFNDSHRRVGHAIRRVIVPDQETGVNVNRTVDVHLWYPADTRRFSRAPKTPLQLGAVRTSARSCEVGPAVLVRRG